MDILALYTVLTGYAGESLSVPHLVVSLYRNEFAASHLAVLTYSALHGRDQRETNPRQSSMQPTEKY